MIGGTFYGFSIGTSSFDLHSSQNNSTRCRSTITFEDCDDVKKGKLRQHPSARCNCETVQSIVRFRWALVFKRYTRRSWLKLVLWNYRGSSSQIRGILFGASNLGDTTSVSQTYLDTLPQYLEKLIASSNRRCTFL
jgi:hypothetical protein